MSTLQNITPTELYERMRSGMPLNLIDVRSPREYESVHVAGARNVPLGQLPQMDHSTTSGQPLYVICHVGGRSRAACDFLAEQGVEAVNVEGGTLAWERAGLPLERAAGGSSANWLRVGGLLLMAAGILLGLLVNPYFFLGAAGVWFALVVTGNAPCCCSSTCAPKSNA